MGGVSVSGSSDFMLLYQTNINEGVLTSGLDLTYYMQQCLVGGVFRVWGMGFRIGGADKGRGRQLDYIP